MFGIPKLAIYAAIGLAALGALTWLYTAVKDSGVQQERQRIEQANTEARRKADEGSATVDDCFRIGGTWDRARGVCDRPR
jgi:hypothetical protein